MSKRITRHLKYAHVEFASPQDAQAFTDGLYRLGWANAMSAFPIQRDRWGARCVDSAHPLLPIRWRGTALLILPNERSSLGERPYIADPIFEAFRRAKGNSAFDAEIEKQNEFIANWIFSPGVKAVSDTERRLTIDPDFTDFVDLVAISGHGAAGSCWGGGKMVNLKDGVRNNPTSNRLKYVLIAACFNLAMSNCDNWIPALRRNNPVHGVLGYCDVYPGGQRAATFLQRFTQNLRGRAGSGAAPGTKPILNAWREAHGGVKIWAALMHSSAKADCMADWLAGSLSTPASDGEVRWFSEDNYPTGEVYVEPVPDYTVFFYMGSTKIDRTNNAHPDVGLFPGDSGSLEIAKRSGPFFTGDKITVVFYYYRPNKDGMDLKALLTFGSAPEGKLVLKTDVNQKDRTTHTDALEFTFTRAGVHKVMIPYTVNSDATSRYKNDGYVHGYFNVAITPPGLIVGGPSDLRPYPDCAWLRRARP